MNLPNLNEARIRTDKKSIVKDNVYGFEKKFDGKKLCYLEVLKSV